MKPLRLNPPFNINLITESDLFKHYKVNPAVKLLESSPKELPMIGGFNPVTGGKGFEDSRENS